MFGVWAQHCPGLVAHVLLSQLNSLSPHPWSSVLQSVSRDEGGKNAVRRGQIGSGLQQCDDIGLSWRLDSLTCRQARVYSGELHPARSNRTEQHESTTPPSGAKSRRRGGTKGKCQPAAPVGVPFVI